MSDYEITETSLQDGSPRELYEFLVGGIFFRFVNGETSEIRDGQTYLPAVISRSNVKRKGAKFESEVEIQMSIHDTSIASFATQWAAIPPDGTVTLRIYERHLQDTGPEVTRYRTMFIGDVSSVRYDRKQARMLCKTIGDLLSREGPKDTWGANCENIFGDGFCTVILGLFTKVLPVTTVAADGVTLTINTAGDGLVDGDYIGGYIKISANPFDFRWIVDHAGDVITIQHPFANLVGGTVVDVIQGCGHVMGDCDGRFSNIDNYGGTPYTPRLNPFEKGLKAL